MHETCLLSPFPHPEPYPPLVSLLQVGLDLSPAPFTRFIEVNYTVSAMGTAGRCGALWSGCMADSCLGGLPASTEPCLPLRPLSCPPAAPGPQRCRAPQRSDCCVPGRCQPVSIRTGLSSPLSQCLVRFGFARRGREAATLRALPAARWLPGRCLGQQTSMHCLAVTCPLRSCPICHPTPTPVPIFRPCTGACPAQRSGRRSGRARRLCWWPRLRLTVLTRRPRWGFWKGGVWGCMGGDGWGGGARLLY